MGGLIVFLCKDTKNSVSQTRTGDNLVNGPLSLDGTVVRQNVKECRSLTPDGCRWTHSSLHLRGDCVISEVYSGVGPVVELTLKSFLLLGHCRSMWCRFND